MFDLNKNLKKCPHCNSKNIRFAQIRKNISIEKKIYRCKNCRKRFTIDNSFKKFRYSPIIIKSAIKILEEGSSLGQTVYYLNKTFRVRITRKTILDWKRKFI
ncbi:MAG: hypothetical protein V1889_03675 [archaeon]